MYDFRARRQVLQAIFAGLLLLFMFRLFYLQVLSPDFAASADRNVIKRLVLEPTRGVIYDRQGRIYVTNTPIFDLNIVPRELVIPDTSIFERYLHLDRETIRRRIKAAADYNRHKASIFEKQINADVYSALQEQLWACKGIYPVVRNTRNYLYPVGANFLGYISEVNKKDIDRSGGYYTQGDLIGTTGLERHYEYLLRGHKGVKMTMVDVHGREVGEFGEGKYDTIPVQGEDIVVTVDADLQTLGEALMAHKLGSIVALEPATGEILAFISSPSYDPNLLSGQESAQHFYSLSHDSLKPLLNRPLSGLYPPGSIFKLLNAITGLSEGTLSEYTAYGCAGGFMRNGGRPHCHLHPSPLTLEGAIQHSCNAYFAAVYVDMLHSARFGNFSQAFQTWHEYMSRFGIGHRLGIDIPNEKPGMLPTEQFYNKWYGANRWAAMTVVSNAIGQGEVTMTPLQMGNVTAVLANRGYYVQPHFLKSLPNSGLRKAPHFDTVRAQIPAQLFTVVANGMEKVVQAGTGFLAQIPGVSVCGKTGTAENTHGDDHSVFIAYAPKDNPKIAIAVIVENGGFGGVWAAPIASLMIERYLTGQLTDRWKLMRVLEADFMHAISTVKGPVPGHVDASLLLTMLEKRGIVKFGKPLGPIVPTPPPLEPQLQLTSIPVLGHSDTLLKQRTALLPGAVLPPKSLRHQ